jgi:hypothetical protein
MGIMLLPTELTLHQNPQVAVFRLPLVITVNRPAVVMSHWDAGHLCHTVFQALDHSLAQKLEITANVEVMVLLD